MSGEQMCRECRNAEWECLEFYNGYQTYIHDGCKKDLTPYYDPEEETYECEGYRNDSIRTE